MNEKFIRLNEVICENNKLTFKFDSSLKIFKAEEFFIEYGKNIDIFSESINAIPFAAVMAPISWAFGANLILSSLDHKYISSLESINNVFKKWFPKRWSFRSKLTTVPTENNPSTSRYGMLFSGGLDSLTTYIRNKDKNPALFTIFGIDIPLSESNFIAQCKEKFNEFATTQGLEINYINTNVINVINFKKLQRYSKNWYGEVAHGLMLTSITAPINYGYLKHLLIASSHTEDFRNPWGSNIAIDGLIHWGNTAVLHDGYGIIRSKKIANYFQKDEEFYKYLRVCLSQFEQFNCSKCEKCSRTICELLINNIDPTKCNFSISKDTLIRLRNRLRWKYYVYFLHGTFLYWRLIRNSIDFDKLRDMYGSEDFFRWLANFSKLEQEPNKVILIFFNRLLLMKDFLKQALNFLSKYSKKESTNFKAV